MQKELKQQPRNTQRSSPCEVQKILLEEHGGGGGAAHEGHSLCTLLSDPFLCFQMLMPGKSSGYYEKVKIAP